MFQGSYNFCCRSIIKFAICYQRHQPDTKHVGEHIHLRNQNTLNQYWLVPKWLRQHTFKISNFNIGTMFWKIFLPNYVCFRPTFLVEKQMVSMIKLISIGISQNTNVLLLEPCLGVLIIWWPMLHILPSYVYEGPGEHTLDFQRPPPLLYQTRFTTTLICLSYDSINYCIGLTTPKTINSHVWFPFVTSSGMMKLENSIGIHIIYHDWLSPYFFINL